MELKLLQDNGTLGAGVQASPEVFEREYNEALVHQVVVAYQANAVSYTHLTLPTNREV